MVSFQARPKRAPSKSFGMAPEPNAMFEPATWKHPTREPKRRTSGFGTQATTSHEFGEFRTHLVHVATSIFDRIG